MFQTTIAYFMRGGPCMWPLLLCSMAVVFIAVERILYYRKVISPEAFVLQFCQLMNAGKRKEARDTAGVTSGLAEALITTIFGLIIAIAGTCVHAYLSHRCRNASLNLDTIADVLAARLKEGGES